jgi:hypothetical protein
VVLFLKILGALLALGLGLYLGGAGQYRPDHDEIDKALTVVVQAVSQKARDAVEKAGGEIRVLKPEPTADKPAPETKTGETTVAEKTPPDVPEEPAGEAEEQGAEERTEEGGGGGAEESAEASTGEASPESTGETLEEAGDGTEDEESKEISEP